MSDSRYGRGLAAAIAPFALSAAAWGKQAPLPPCTCI